MDEIKNNRILEVGCGAGRFTQIVCDAGAELYSFDLSNSVDACLDNNKHCQNLHILQADIYKIPLKKNFFDKIFCFGVLQHTPDPEQAFLSLIPYLRVGGRDRG